MKAYTRAFTIQDNLNRHHHHAEHILSLIIMVIYFVHSEIQRKPKNTYLQRTTLTVMYLNSNIIMWFLLKILMSFLNNYFNSLLRIHSNLLLIFLTLKKIASNEGRISFCLAKFISPSPFILHLIVYINIIHIFIH